MKKNFKYLLLGLVIFLAGATFFLSVRKAPMSPKVEVAQTQATLVIDYGNGNKIASSFIPEQGESAYGALKSVAEEKKITLDTQQYDFGIFVKSIGGYESSADMAWIYYINGTSGMVAADKQEIKAGDTIEWRFVKPQ